ncbi:MAG TPA: hypothetical protein DCS93_03320 [Microscillaceae bacterium]|nr:hypothetical protein [Microscillaceae bacterium]
MSNHQDHQNTPVILLAFANPRQDLALSQEKKIIDKALAEARAKKWCEVLVESSTDLKTLYDIFLDDRYRGRIAVFHFAGHANEENLLLQQETIAGKPWADFLAKQNGLKLVFLNACATQQQAEYLSEQAENTAVIATDIPVDDYDALQIVERFYHSLGKNCSIQQSFDHAIDFGGALGSVESVSRASDRNKNKKRQIIKVKEQHWDIYTENKENLTWKLETAQNDPYFGLPVLPLNKYHLPKIPYVSLKHYTEKEASVFFGRGWKIRTLYQEITDENIAPMMLLYGQSGVGKSSLLAAGLKPRLEANYEVKYLRLGETKGLESMFSLALQGDESASLSPEEAAKTWHRIETQSDRQLMIIFDQFEEVFTKNTPQKAKELLVKFAHFVDNMWKTRRPRGKLILSFRKEYLPEIEELLTPYAFNYTKHFVEMLNKAEVKEVINGLQSNIHLQRQYKLSIEEDFIEQVTADIYKNKGAIAPLLQILLSRMWEVMDRSEDRRIFDVALYEKVKLISLKDFLLEQLEKLKKGSRADEKPVETYEEEVNSGLVLDILYFFTTERGTASVQKRAEVLKEYRHQIDCLEGLFQRLIELRLLVSAGDSLLTLSHDTLAPIVRALHAQNEHPGQIATRMLENKVRAFEENEKNVLNQYDLATIEQGINGMRSLNEDEEELVAASRKDVKERRRNNQRLKIGGFLGVLAFVASGVVAWKATQQAKKANIEKEEEIKQREDTNRQKEQTIALKDSLLADKSDSLKAALEEAKKQGDVALQQKIEAQVAQQMAKAQNLAAIADRSFKQDARYALSQARLAYQLAEPTPDFFIQNALANSFYAWLQTTDPAAKEIAAQRELPNWQQTQPTLSYADWSLSKINDLVLRLDNQRSGQVQPVQLKTELYDRLEEASPALSTNSTYLGLINAGIPQIYRVNSSERLFFKESPPREGITQIFFSIDEKRLALLTIKPQPMITWYELGQPITLSGKMALPFVPDAMCFAHQNELLLAQGNAVYRLKIVPQQSPEFSLLLTALIVGQKKLQINQMVTSPMGNYLLLINHSAGLWQVWDAKGKLIIEQAPHYLPKGAGIRSQHIAFAQDDSRIYVPFTNSPAVIEILLPKAIYQTLQKPEKKL